MGILIGFFNSSFFVALVGLAAIYIYFRQRNDKKRDAAKLILQEIRYAEQQIRNSGRGSHGYSLWSKLLPTSSWNDNVHLFTRDLKETQIDMISEFYSKATYIDFLIKERSRQKINPKPPTQVIPQVTQPPGAVTAQNPLPVEGSPQHQNQQQIMQLIQLPTLDELVTNQLLIQVSASIEFLYNTPAVEKLREISEQKWYHLF